MTIKDIADRFIETDVLVMGGGLGGCPAAFKAAEHGLDVTLVEKAKPERSGACAMGRDEIQPFARDGVTALDLVKAVQKQNETWGDLEDPNPLYILFDNSMWTLDELERMGISMKYLDGQYHWTAFSNVSTGALLSLQVPWLNVKPEMGTAVRKKGVKVLDRTMVVDLLTHKGKVAGATAVNTRTGEFIVIKAKAIAIAAGRFSRLFDPIMPVPWKYKMNYDLLPGSGDGHAVAYRAGSDLTSMELWRCGHSPDELVLRGCHFGEDGVVSGKIFTSTGKVVGARQRTSIGPLEYREYELKGLDPLYKSIEDIPEDFHKRIEVAIIHERMVQFKFAEDRGFNPRTHRYEIGISHHASMTEHAAGIKVDENLQGSLKGVFAIGDCHASNGIGGLGALTGGFYVGDNVHKYVSSVGEPALDEEQLESQKRIALAPLAVNDGVEPMELECAVRRICGVYGGTLKTEGKLKEGLRRLGSLRRAFLPKLAAANPHYLMRCLEVRNIMDMAEVYFQACLARNETRGIYYRLDHPGKDPSMDNKRICQRMENGKAVLEVRDVPALKPEFAGG